MVKSRNSLARTAGLAVRVIKCRTGVRIGLSVHGFLEGRRAVDRQHLDAAGLGVSQADITDAIRVLADFRGDLLVAAIFCEPPA